MNDQQLLRYSRQILLPQIDIAGQQKLLNARVLVVGLGGLGSPVAMYLAAAGVGHLLLTDFDEVDLSNLQRQIIHSQVDIGRSKVESAKDRLTQLNPDLRITSLARRLEPDELQKWIASVDLVVDCSDNITTRQQLNMACLQLKIPLVSGAAIGFEGQVTVFDFRVPSSPCYGCLYGENSEQNLSCSESGVIAPLVGIIGSVQALESIKLLVGIGQSLEGKLLLLDGLTMSWQTLTLGKQAGCSVCGAVASEFG